MADVGAWQGKTMTLRSDSDVKKHIEAELGCCPNVDETDIAVKVTGGVVSLTGSVPDLFQKYGAEDAVKRVAGVVAVANDIEVRAPAPEWAPDVQIARAAVAAIKRQVPLRWEQIRPVVHQGCVTLEGAVDWIYQREEAEEAVRRVKGVVCVINSIALAPPAKPIRPEDVKRLIAEARPGSVEIDAGAIAVEAQGAEVILRGRVHSWAARSQAEQSARLAPGVQRVRNELTVDSEHATADHGARISIDPNTATRGVPLS